MKYTTRIAPSPTGDFHLGTARTAYFSWLAARQSGGEFIVRIDDTDKERNVEGAVDTIYRCLDWLGLDYDRTFKQSDQQEVYLEAAADLEVEGKTFRAENGALLLNWDHPTQWEDELSGPQFSNDKNQELYKNQVILKADGTPTYHFASVVDDMCSGVNFVLRGMDHFTNTFRHAAFYDALQSGKPKFGHVGLIMYKKKKLSKRDAAASLLSYKDSGVDPDAMLNFLLRLGWSPTQDDKSNNFINKEKALTMFLDKGNMKPSPAALDFNKLAWFDKKYKGFKSGS